MKGIKKKLSRFAVALGGFLIFVGIILTAVFITSFSGFVDFSLLETKNIQNISLLLLLLIGLLDLVAGIILLRR